MKKILLLFLALAGVAGAVWYFGFASDVERRQLVRKGKSMGYDAKFHLERATDTISTEAGASGNLEEARQCRVVIRRIESAKRAVAKDMGLAYGAEVPVQKICTQMGLQELPKCPAGGRYRVMPVGKVVRCSIGVNRTDDLNDDHIVKDF